MVGVRVSTVVLRLPEIQHPGEAGVEVADR